jgi:hypothetical protein
VSSSNGGACEDGGAERKRDMAVQTVHAVRPAVCVAAVMLLSAGALAFAQDAAPAQTDLARPSGEDPTIPMHENKAGAQKPAESAQRTVRI